MARGAWRVLRCVANEQKDQLRQRSSAAATRAIKATRDPGSKKRELGGACCGTAPPRALLSAWHAPLAGSRPGVWPLLSPSPLGKLLMHILFLVRFIRRGGTAAAGGGASLPLRLGRAGWVGCGPVGSDEHTRDGYTHIWDHGGLGGRVGVTWKHTLFLAAAACNGVWRSFLPTHTGLVALFIWLFESHTLHRALWCVGSVCYTRERWCNASSTHSSPPPAWLPTPPGPTPPSPTH